MWYYLTIFLLLFLTINADCADNYDISVLPPYTLNIAKKSGIHKKIIKKAESKKILQNDFKQFYLKEAGILFEQLNADYFTALKEISLNPKTALEKYSKLAESNQSNADYYIFKAMAEEALNLNTDALISYQNGLNIDPEGHNGIVNYRRGLLFAKLGFEDIALYDMTQSLVIAPFNPYAYQSRSEYYFNLGRYREAADDLNSFFSLGAADNIRHTESLSLKCEVLKYRKYKVKDCAELNYSLPHDYKEHFANIETAIKAEALEHGIKTDDGLAVLYAVYAMQALHSSGHPIHRLKIADDLLTREIELLKLSSIEPIISTYTSVSLSVNSSPHVLKSALSAPYSRRAIVRYRLADFRVGTYEKALDDYTRSIKLGNNSWDYKMRSDIYSMYGERKKALSDINTAIKINPDNPYFYQQRAAIYLTLNVPIAAKEDLEKFFSKKAKTAYGIRVSKGAECLILTLNGFEVNGCADAEYFKQSGRKVRTVKRFPPEQRTFSYTQSLGSQVR